MVQIYERPPTFSEQMARSIGGALGGVAKGALEGHLEKKRRKSEDEILESEFGMKFPANRELRKLMVAEALKGRSEAAKSSQKQQAAQKAEEEEMKGLGSTLDWLDENIGYTGTKVIPGFKSFTAGGLNRETVGKREEFDKTGFWAADKAFAHINKGVLNKEKFKELKEELAPNSKLSERKNKARINSIRRIAKIPSNVSPKEFEKRVDAEMKAVKKIEKAASGKEKLTDEIIDMFLEQSDGNPTEAKRLAKEAGYKW